MDLKNVQIYMDVDFLQFFLEFIPEWKPRGLIPRDPVPDRV